MGEIGGFIGSWRGKGVRAKGAKGLGEGGVSTSGGNGGNTGC